MLLGFTGASATGKSRAAGKLAALLSSVHVESTAATVAKHMGFDVNAPHTFQERMDYQTVVLNWMEDDIDGEPCGAIFDRTPVDLMAFAILAHSDETPENKVILDKYLERCVKVAEKFDYIVLISPEPEQLLGTGEYKEGRLKAEVHGEDFRVLYDKVIKMLLQHPKLCRKVIVIPEGCEYDDRVAFVLTALGHKVKD